MNIATLNSSYNNGDDVWTGVDNNIDVCYSGFEPLSTARSLASPLLCRTLGCRFTALASTTAITYEAQEADINQILRIGYGDNLGYFSTDEWTVHSALKCNKAEPEHRAAYKGAYSWIGVAGSTFGFYFGDNYGFLSCSIPAKGNKAHQVGTVVRKIEDRSKRPR